MIFFRNFNISMEDRFIEYLRLYHDIPADDSDIIKSKLFCQDVSEGKYLLTEGEVCKKIFFVCRGVLRIVSQQSTGTEVTHYFLKENQFGVVLESFDNDTPSKESIQAVCDSEIIVLHKTALLSLYQTLPYFKAMVNTITQKALLEKIHTRNFYLGCNAAMRYQKFLLLESEIALRAPLSMIASYLGVTQQSLSRIRRSA